MSIDCISDLPKYFSLSISHNEHKNTYETIEEYLEYDKHWKEDLDEEDIHQILDSNELWEIRVYPITPISFYIVRDATLLGCLNKLNELHKDGKWM